MTEAIPEYKVTHKAMPCPFCGSENIVGNEWTVDDDHAKQFDADEFSTVWAFECSDCLGAAPLVSWNKRHSPTLESTPGWHYPKDNYDLENMPAPGEIVVLFYEGEDGNPVGPVICTPIHAEGLHIVNGKNIYRRCIRWHAVPEE